MMDPIELTARAICKSYHDQLAETGGMYPDAFGDAPVWQEWTQEARAALAVAVELPKSTIRKALGRRSDNTEQEGQQ